MTDQDIDSIYKSALSVSHFAGLRASDAASVQAMNVQFDVSDA